MEDPYPSHKLCGFLSTVLALPSLDPSLSFLSPCHVFADGSEIGFKAQNGVFLFPVTSSKIDCPSPLQRNSDVSSSSSSSRKRRYKRGIGMVNGSLSVVHQIQALVSSKCIKVVARILKVQVCESGEHKAKAVVLVDVYLPVELWTGWQFPKSGSIAGALFRHLRFLFSSI